MIIWLRVLRVQQWAKNLLVFLPLILSHQIDDPVALVKTSLAFVAFCFCASGLYMTNDLLDLEADRRHPRKKMRPLAAGEVSRWTGGALAFALLIGLASVLPFLETQFALWLAVYAALGVSYSLWLKKYAVVDVLVLAGFYTIRILSGCAVIAVNPSFWLLASSLFLFFSLATVKRYSELLTIEQIGDVTLPGRGYTGADRPMLQNFGVAAGYAAILVAALYIDSPESSVLYKNPEVLWLTCPALLFWVSRIWLLAGRGSLQDDPVAFALSDRVSWAVLILIAACAWVAV